MKEEKTQTKISLNTTLVSRLWSICFHFFVHGTLYTYKRFNLVLVYLISFNLVLSGYFGTFIFIFYFIFKGIKMGTF